MEETNSEPKTNSEEKDEVRQVEPDVYVRRPKGSKYIIEYRRDVCIGAVTCAEIAQHTFEMDNSANKAMLIAKETEFDEDEVILAAAQSCPVFAIIIRDAETGKQVFPPLAEELDE